MAHYWTPEMRARQSERMRARGSEPKRPTIDMLAALSAKLLGAGIRAEATLELPYLEWVKLLHTLEEETQTTHHIGGVVDPLITRGCWFYAAGIKIRSCG